LFSHSLSGDVVVWFRCLEASSIGSWTELYHAFLKCWGENKSLDQYWFDFNASGRGEDESLVVFNKRFYSVYHNMPMEIRPSETSTMVYYIMTQHLELVFLLRERKSSSLIHLFEYAIEVEENIRASRWVHKHDNVHIQEEEDCQSVSDSEQGYINYGSDLEQEPGSKYDSPMELVPSSFADFSGGMDAYLSDDQFSDHFEHGTIAGCINSCMLLTDHNYFDLNPVSPLADDHFSGGRGVAANDQELFSDEEEGHSFVSREVFAEEHPGLLKKSRFCHISHDPVAIYMESYISDFLKCSYSIGSPILIVEYCVMKDFQDLTLLIKENPWVEITSTRLVGSIEKHKYEGLSGHLISYPELVFEQVSPHINQPISVLCPLVHSEDIRPQVNNHEGQEMFSNQLSSPDIRYYDPMGSYIEFFFPKALEPINIFPFPVFGGMDIILSLVFILMSYLPNIMLSICNRERDQITK
jgi:hypothetical protein